jgi:hypothetical protein
MMDRDALILRTLFGISPILERQTRNSMVKFKVENADAESARGISPRAAHRTGRKPLDLFGSCHPMKAAAFRQNLRVPPVAS